MLLLAMYQDNQDEADKTLPKFIDALKASNVNNDEFVLQTLINLKSDFSQYGFVSQSHYITKVLVNQCKTYEDRISALVVQYIENMTDSAITSKIETELNELRPSRTSENYNSHIALIESLKVLKYLSNGDIEDAKKTYLKIQEDDLDACMDKTSFLYLTYLLVIRLTER